MTFHTNAMVWSAIKYLDSPTDYRELLSEPTGPQNLRFGPLVLIDDQHVGIRTRCWKAALRMVVCLRSVMPSRFVH